MKVEITGDHEAWLRAEVAAGRFPSTEAALAHAIDVAKLTDLRRTLATAVARGGDNDAEVVRSRVRARLRSGPPLAKT